MLHSSHRFGCAEREERSWERNVGEESGVINLGLWGNTDLPHTRVKITAHPAAIGWALCIMGFKALDGGGDF